MKLAVAAELACSANCAHGLVAPEHPADPDTDDQSLKLYPVAGVGVHS